MMMRVYSRGNRVRLVKSVFHDTPECSTGFYRYVPEKCPQWYFTRGDCWIDRYTLGAIAHEDGRLLKQVYHYADSNRVKTPYFSCSYRYLERLCNKLNYGD